MRGFRLSAVLWAAAALAAPAREAVLASGPRRVHLIELYTSEGCSSCPPADRWLSGLREDPGLWRRFVPVGLHVGYWDRLGWKDRLADERFVARQHALARAWGAEFVYTPAFALDGAEWRSRLLPRKTPDSPGGPAGVLEARARPDGRVSVRWRPEHAEPGARWSAHAALLGGEVRTEVLAGENRGRSLRHDFAALAYARADMEPVEDGATAGLTLGAPSSEARAHALAVWVSRAGETAPAQAAGGPLPFKVNVR